MSLERLDRSLFQLFEPHPCLRPVGALSPHGSIPSPTPPAPILPPLRLTTSRKRWPLPPSHSLVSLGPCDTRAEATDDLTGAASPPSALKASAARLHDALATRHGHDVDAASQCVGSCVDVRRSAPRLLADLHREARSSMRLHRPQLYVLPLPPTRHHPQLHLLPRSLSPPPFVFLPALTSKHRPLPLRRDPRLPSCPPDLCPQNVRHGILP